ncbi:G-protein coupled receptor Mth2 [Orchesella cincta]|uniref:G-protein coupled receptor Mth2 n=1 Tax=Orchesella cincta TaxID=48709 RepID=A0A1D2N8M8_ORCCI|nr:G-protein coupled receptor Mth2 [Orchesella cincta]
MSLRIDKSLLLVAFYLCVHFQYCLPQSSSSISTSSNYDVYKCTGRLHDTRETTVTIPGQFVSDNATKTFPLKRKELNCKKGRFKVLFQLPHQNEDSSSLESPGSVKVLRTDLKTRKTVSYADPQIKIMSDLPYLRISNEFFHPNEYCFDQIDSNELSLFVCYPECYGQRPCVTKCCGQDEVWDVNNARCKRVLDSAILSSKSVPDNNTTVNSSSSVNNGTKPHYWSPWLFSRSVDKCVKRVTAYHRQQIDIHIQQRLPSCDPSTYVQIPLRKIHNHAVQRFRVLWTGQVIMRDKRGNWSEFSQGRYCVDGMTNFGHGDVYTGAFEDQILLVCPDQAPLTVQKKPIPLRYAVMLLGSAAILFLTALISTLMWDRQNVYEWTVSCEVISMFFMILLVGIAHTIARKPEKSDFGSIHCVFIGAASHFFWLSTFCWLFIINFEIWWNFRNLVQLRQSRKWFRFSVYMLVGWGCPLVMVVVGLFLDRVWGLQNEDLDCTNVIVPNYGQTNCYISKQAQGPYLFYPIGLVLVINLLFYLLTVCKMWGYQKKSQAIIQYRSKGQTQPILIFAKLFIVMGVSWIFEIISWGTTSSDVDRIPLYWVIFDIVTLFQAVCIFVIFIWKKETLSRLWYKYPCFQPLLAPLSKLPGCGLLPNERDRLASL